MQLSRSRRLAGSTLLEVLVALVLAGVGLLTLAALHAQALQTSRQTLHRTVAGHLVGDLAERLRAHGGGAWPLDAGPAPYQLALSWSAQQADGPALAPACEGLRSACTPAQFAQADLAQWRALLRRSLPSAAAWVQLDPARGLADIWVAWAEPPPARRDEVPQADGECPGGLGVSPDAGVRCLHARVAW